MTVPLAALVEPRACSAPRLRALAAALAGAPAGVIGTEPDAQRARDAGIAVRRSLAPALGSLATAGRALAQAFPTVVRGSRVVVAGGRAADAARALGAEPVGLPDAEPAPSGPLAREPLRAAWGAAPGVAACLLVASPAPAADAHAALDLAGRAAILGGPVVLVVHPGSGNVDRARRLACAAGGAWRIALDARADDPELLALAVDAALAIDLRRPEGIRVPQGPAARAAAFARGCAPEVPEGDALGARLALRAGVPVLSASCAAAARCGAVPPGRCFELRRPNEGARLLHAILSAASR